MTRTQILERLYLGRMVEAELQKCPQGKRTFIEVRPLIKQSEAQFNRVDVGIEPVLVRVAPNANVIAGYNIRSCTLNPGWELEPDDWDRYLDNEQRISCASLTELEQQLSVQFNCSLESLQVPGSTDSPL